MRPIDGDELYVKLKDAGMVFALHMVESAPTIASPPNDPLTLEDLRELDGEPVYIDFGDGGEWVLVRAPLANLDIARRRGRSEGAGMF